MSLYSQLQCCKITVIHCTIHGEVLDANSKTRSVRSWKTCSAAKKHIDILREALDATPLTKLDLEKLLYCSDIHGEVLDANPLTKHEKPVILQRNTMISLEKLWMQLHSQNQISLLDLEKLLYCSDIHGEVLDANPLRNLLSDIIPPAALPCWLRHWSGQVHARTGREDSGGRDCLHPSRGAGRTELPALQLCHAPRREGSERPPHEDSSSQAHRLWWVVVCLVVCWFTILHTLQVSAIFLNQLRIYVYEDLERVSWLEKRPDFMDEVIRTYMLLLCWNKTKCPDDVLISGCPHFSGWTWYRLLAPTALFLRLLVFCRDICHCGQPHGQEKDSHWYPVLDGTRGKGLIVTLSLVTVPTNTSDSHDMMWCCVVLYVYLCIMLTWYQQS